MKTQTQTKTSHQSPEPRVYKLLSKQSAARSAHTQRRKITVSFRRKALYKRCSPFLMLVPLLLLLLPFQLISNTGIVSNKFLLVLIYAFMLVYTLFTDFALWNYFEGKKKLLIWIIELPLSSALLYFLL